MLKLFNTATNSIDEFTPMNAGEVSLYTCGLTVYDYGHIGNFRTFLLYDILRRTLEVQGYDVLHIQNVTDVGHLTDDADAGDDKMEKGAAREGRTAWEVASFYTAAWLEDSVALNIKRASVIPKATDHIQEQIDLVQKLEEKGHTYTTSDGIYFDTSTFADYGKMARLDIEGLQEGARVEAHAEKKNPTDFALWKFSPQNGTQRAMEWESPWGIGFPGWHLECSAMAMKYLGDTMDIHAGGVDHKPIHHTNEIAQSEAASGKPFAHWWVHADFLQVDGGKMGKSLGNAYTLDDMQERGYSPLDYRYFVLSSHYRSKLNFTWKAMDSAQTAMNKLVWKLSQWDETGNVIENLYSNFMAAVENDLNLSEALAVLWATVKSANKNGDKAATLYKMDEILGLALRSQADNMRNRIDAAGENMQQLLIERDEARSDKNWEIADQIRDQIAKMGFIVEDTDDGAILRPAKPNEQ